MNYRWIGALALALAPTALAQTEVAHVNPSFLVEQAMGSSVAIHAAGDFLVASAPRHAGDDGVVYVYKPGPTSSWTLSNSLSPFESGSEFGKSVATDGTYLIVGAPKEASGGRVHMYLSFADFANSSNPEPSGVHAGDEFGHSVDILADVAAVGAPFTDSVAPNAGRTYFLHYSLETLSWLDFSTAPAGLEANSRYGWSVDLANGTRAIVGAPGLGINGVGRAYIHDFSGSEWSLSTTLESGESGDAFGYAVALDGTRAAVGAPTANLDGRLGGAVYTFRRSRAGWVLDDVLLPPAGSAYDSGGFGSALALEGERLVVGAPGAAPVGIGSGGVLAYERSGFDWTLVSELLPSGLQPGSQLGNALDLRGGWLGLGAVGELDSSGGAHVYQYPPEVELFCNGPALPCPCGGSAGEGGCENSSGEGGRLAALVGSVSLSRDDLVLRAENLTGSSAFLIASEASALVPFGSGVLCLGTPRYSFSPLSVVAGGRNFGPGLAAQAAALGASLVPGDSFGFQVRYRDLGGSCASFNLTNAVRVVYGF